MLRQARQISSPRKLNLKQVLPQVDEDGGLEGHRSQSDLGIH